MGSIRLAPGRNVPAMAESWLPPSEPTTYVRLLPELTVVWVRPGDPRMFSPLPTVLMMGTGPLIAPTAPPPKFRATGLSVPGLTTVRPEAEVSPVAAPIDVPLASPLAEPLVAPVEVALIFS